MTPMNKILRRSCFLLLGGLPASALWAAPVELPGLKTIVLAESLPAQPDHTRVHAFDPLVVTGTRTEQRLSQSPVPVIVIGAAELARSGARDLAELLQREGGVYVSQAAGRGSTIEIQGLSSEHVLILVDGRRINGRVNGAVDLSRLRLAQIERLEIVRGPSSALYGADALGGVVNVITRRSRADEGMLQLRGQADGSADVMGQAALQRGAWSVQSDAQFSHVEAYDLDPSRAGDDGAQRDLLAVSARAQREFAAAGPLQWLGLDWAWSQDDSTRQDAGSGGAMFETRKRVEELRLGLAPQLLWGEAEIKLDGFYHRYHDQYLQQRTSGAVVDDEETLDEVFAAGVQWNHALGEHELTAGLEHQLERLQADRLQQDAQRDRQSLYVQDVWRHGALSLVPGLRYDRDSQFGDQWSPKLALRWDIDAYWMLRAGYGHGYRAPDFKQLYLRFDNAAVGYQVRGNPQLQAERSRGFNLSTTWYASAHSSLHLELFANRVSDLIELVQDEMGPPTIYSYRNVRSARLYGADLQWQWRLDPAHPLQLKLGYGYLHSRDDDTDQPLSGRPSHRGNLALYYARARWALGLHGVWIGAREFAVDTSSGGPPTQAGRARPYSLMDLRAEWRGWQAEHGLSLATGVKNLLDAGDPRFLPIAPRTTYLELKRTF